MDFLEFCGYYGLEQADGLALLMKHLRDAEGRWPFDESRSDPDPGGMHRRASSPRRFDYRDYGPDDGTEISKGLNGKRKW